MPIPEPLRRRAGAILTGLLLFLVFQQLYFWTGRYLLGAGALEGYSLFGWDVPRVIEDITRPGSNQRSNVHPLFTLGAKPLGWFFQRVAGFGAPTAAIATCSGAAAAAVLAVWAFHRAWGAGRIESALFAALFGVSTTPLFMGAIPETGSFIILSLAIAYLLTALALRRSHRSAVLWVLSGVFTFGVAISNLAVQAAAFLAASPPGHSAAPLLRRFAIWFGFVLLVTLALWKAAGSSFEIGRERWVVTDDQRGGRLENLASHLVKGFVLHAAVAPRPSRSIVNEVIAEERVEIEDLELIHFTGAAFDPTGRALALAWLSLLGLGAALAIGARDPLDLRLAALGSVHLLFVLGIFSIYYVRFEGVFLYTPHGAVALIPWCAFVARRLSGLTGRARAAGLAAVGLFVAVLTLNNLRAIGMVVELLRGTG